MGRRATALAVLLLSLPPVAAAEEGPAFDRALKAVVDAGADPAARVEAAAVLAGAVEPAAKERAVATLVGALADAEPRVRIAAADALARLSDERALARLSRRLDVERDPQALGALLLAVGALGKDPEVSTVASFLAHAEASVRAAAATALGDLGGATARERLLSLLAAPGDDPEWGVRGAVLLALSRCGKREDSGTVLVAYRDGGGAGHWFARAALARAVAALDSDPVPILDRLAADDDARVSSVAAAAFVRAGKPEELVKRLSDARPGVRAACAAAVAETALAAAVPRLRSLATEDPVRAVRWSAALALSRLDDPASDGLLVAALSSDDPQVWAQALAECRRKTGAEIGRDPDAWAKALAARRAGRAK